MTEHTAGSATGIDLAARAMAKHAGWDAWATATNSSHTPNGNEPDEEREYWRELAAIALARATPQHPDTLSEFKEWAASNGFDPDETVDAVKIIEWIKRARRWESKLDAVWADLRTMIEKHSGKPCAGEPLDVLDELLAGAALTHRATTTTALLAEAVKAMDDNDEPGAGSEWHTQAKAALDDVAQLLATLTPILDAVDANDSDSLAMIDCDNTVIWTAMSSWGPSVPITLGHLREIDRAAKKVSPK